MSVPLSTQASTIEMRPVQSDITSITVNGVTISPSLSNPATWKSAPVMLQPSGPTVFTIVITAANGSTRTYTTTVTRQLPVGIAVLNADGSPLLDSKSIFTWGTAGVEPNAPAGLTDVKAVSIGSSHTLALKNDGTVVAWGPYVNSAQLQVPAGLTGVQSIAAGWSHSLALKSDGTVVAWGDNTEGQVSVPAGLTDVKAIGVGPTHSLAVKNDGTVVAWGRSQNGEISVPAGLTDVKVVTGGNASSTALKNDGSIVQWGTGTYIMTGMPEGLTGLKDIATSQHAVALTSNGQVLAWGESAHGQIAVPAGLGEVKAIAAGNIHSMALKKDGSVAAWGGGVGSPVGLSYAESIAASAGRSVALINRPLFVKTTTSAAVTKTFTIRNTGTSALTLTAPTVSGVSATDFTVSTPSSLTLAAGASTTFTVRFTSNVFGMHNALLRVPSNDANQPNLAISISGLVASDNANLASASLSTGTLSPAFAAGTTSYTSTVSHDTNSLTFTPVVADSNAIVTVNGIAVSSGGATAPIQLAVGNNVITTVVTAHTGTTKTYTITVTRLGAPHLSVAADGSPVNGGLNVTGWGRNTVPSDLGTVQAVATGWYHTLALKSDGSLAAWGTTDITSYNYGQATIPPELTGVVVKAIGAGGMHNLVVKANGTVVAWGNSASYATDVPAGLTGVKAVAGGYRHSLALKENGTVVAWGGNNDGQCDVPSGLTDVVAIAAGPGHSMALKSDGTVVLWGSNSFGALQSPAGLNNVKAIAAGDSFCVALKNDGTVVTWGRSQFGQGPPAGLNDALAIAAGEYHTVALKSDGSIISWNDSYPDNPSLPRVCGVAAGSNYSLAIGTAGSVEFGPIVSKVTKIFAITNDGVANLDVGSITFSGAHAGDFSADIQSASLAPGATTLITVTFRPGALGPRSAFMHLPNNDPAQRSFTVAVTGSGKVNDVNGVVKTTVQQPDGRLLIGGSFSEVDSISRPNLVRLNVDGSVDETFAPQINNSVSSIVALENGKIWVAGDFTTINGIARGYIALLNEDGSLDTSNNPTANGQISGMALQLDGKLIIAGNFTTLKPNGAVNATTRNYIARITAIGTVDGTFNPNANGPVRSVALQEDGRVVLGGDFTSVGGSTRNRVARVTAAGAVDASFNPNANSSVNAVAVTPLGDILLGGGFTSISGLSHAGIAKLTSTGALDDSFTAMANSSVNTVMLQVDGKILLGGNFTTVNGSARGGLARLKADGSLDTTFIRDVSGSNAAVQSIMLLEDGLVLLGGRFSDVAGHARQNLAYMPIANSVAALDQSGSEIEWRRVETAAEAQQVFFDLSTDGGETWTYVAEGTRSTESYLATGVTGLPDSGLLRARARTLSGQANGSSGWVTFQAPFSIGAPEIVVEQPEDTELTSGADTIAYGTLGLNALKPVVVTIRNAGGRPLTGIVAKITGTNANQFSITKAADTTLESLDSTTLTVQAKVTSVGAKTATLSIASNDADENPFLITLTATGVAANVPTATTVAATNVSFRDVNGTDVIDATLNGTVNAKGQVREIYFDCALTSGNYIYTAAADPAQLNISVATPISLVLQELAPHTKYFYRVRAVSDLGNATGAEMSFTTPNHAPVGVADPDTLVLPNGIATIDVLDNDTDADGDALTITAKTAVTPASAGTVAIAADKLSLTFTASATFSGSATFSYTLSDGLATSTALVTVSSGGSIDIDPPAIPQPAAAITYDVNITTQGAWAVTESLAYATVSPTRGVGNGTVKVTLLPNTAKTARAPGVIKIGGATHTVTQSGVLTPTIDQTLSGSTQTTIVSGDFSLVIPTENMPVVYAETNLPPGITMNDSTGTLSGRPTKAGTYNVVVKATNAAAPTAAAAATLSFTIQVDPLPAGVIGTFHGYVERSSTVNVNPVKDLGARFEMTVTNTGLVTGQIFQGVLKKAFTGQLLANVGSPNNPTLPVPSPA